jgi:serine/threonine-protein kinase
MAGRRSDPRDDVFGFGRILEDVLDTLAATDPQLSATAEPRWRPIAAACTGPDAQRPPDGRALLTRVRVEA